MHIRHRTHTGVQMDRAHAGAAGHLLVRMVLQHHPPIGLLDVVGARPPAPLVELEQQRTQIEGQSAELSQQLEEATEALDAYRQRVAEAEEREVSARARAEAAEERAEAAEWSRRVL